MNADPTTNNSPSTTTSVGLAQACPNYGSWWFGVSCSTISPKNLPSQVVPFCQLQCMQYTHHGVIMQYGFQLALSWSVVTNATSLFSVHDRLLGSTLQLPSSYSDWIHAEKFLACLVCSYK